MSGHRLEYAPCPHRILDDAGGAFGMGAVGGGIWYLVKGIRNAPRGERMIGGLHMMQLRSPILAGNFAVWGGMFASYDCLLMHVREKEDPWNAICSGAFTGATLAARAGVRTAATQGLIGGVFLALIEGLSLVMTKWMSKRTQESADASVYTPYYKGAAAETPRVPSYIEEFKDEVTSVDSAGQLDLAADSTGFGVADFEQFDAFGDQFEEVDDSTW